MLIPPPDQRAPVLVTADVANHWQDGSFEVWLLRGRCRLDQGGTTTRAKQAVLWVERGDPLEHRPHKVIAYFEGDVVTEPRVPAVLAHPRPPTTIREQAWLERFYAISTVQVRVPAPGRRPATLPDIFDRAHLARLPVRQSQFQTGVPTPLPPTTSPGGRRIRVFPRGSAGVQARWFPNPETNERIAVIESGVNMIIDGVDAVGTVDVAADRIVIWTAGGELPDLSGQAIQSGATPLEVYLEGNIVFRQGDRVIYAHSMFYNVTTESGIVLDAEVLTPVPDYQGMLRLKADVLQQLDRSNFRAHNAALTTSRMGVPQYWFQSNDLMFRDVQEPLINPFTGTAEVDANTGGPIVDHQLLAVSRNNWFYVAGIPVLYWPVFAADLTKPTYYIDRFRIRNDSIFGFQTLTDYDAYQILGIQNPPEDTDWTVTSDFLSKRGWALGTTFDYESVEPISGWGPATGAFNVWGLYDKGLDTLGRDRRKLIPEEDPRGRILWQHRHLMPQGFQLTAEVGAISDRNFLEQYYEREWDEWKDEVTGVELKRFDENRSISIAGDVRINEFFTQTQGGRLDHFTIGESLGSMLTWYEHSHVGYFDLETLSVPLNAADIAKFNPLAWERDREGVRAATRQEIDLPFSLGPIKVVPYALGEAAHWGEDLGGGDVTRLYGQVGARTSLPIWSVNPQIQNQLFNVNGVAHKVVFETEVLYADADQNLGRFPLYDPLDDDATEHFRRRFIDDPGTIFGGLLGVPNTLTTAPTFFPMFDERSYALRSGLQSWVTSPSTEIADDLAMVRAGIRQRWQTKRGIPGQQRIIDWIVLDVEGSGFPKANRDNFGEDVGLLNYDFRWHVGDRVTLVSDGYADTFANGLQMISVGGFLSRPPRGRVYLGFRSFDGPFSSDILIASYSYWMSPKWISTATTAVDFGATGNIGQRFGFTRIGESFLTRFSVSVDEGRDNVGVNLSFEPRFLGGPASGRVAGTVIPPVGAYGLE